MQNGVRVGVACARSREARSVIRMASSAARSASRGVPWGRDWLPWVPRVHTRTSAVTARRGFRQSEIPTRCPTLRLPRRVPGRAFGGFGDLLGSRELRMAPRIQGSALRQLDSAVALDGEEAILETPAAAVHVDEVVSVLLNAAEHDPHPAGPDCVATVIESSGVR